jgi:hypothetical protein
VGADVVLSRSRFTADMPSLIKKYASTPPYAEIINECEKPAAALALDGIEKFNRGEYYAAHDDLEEAWREDQGATRDLYRALVQVSVAYYHIERENYRGAVKMLLRVRQWLNPLPDICRGIDIAQLRDNIFTVHDSLVDLGPKRIGEFNKTLFKPIRIEGI